MMRVQSIVNLVRDDQPTVHAGPSPYDCEVPKPSTSILLCAHPSAKWQRCSFRTHEQIIYFG